MPTITAYTGPPDAACPITLSYVHDLAHPVAFSSNTSQPYELAPLSKWMLVSNRHPMTGEACTLSDIVVLHVRRCSEEEELRQVDRTEAMLEGMKLTLQNTKEFKEEYKEMEEGISKLNRTIYQLTKDLNDVMVEKVKSYFKTKLTPTFV